MTIGGLPPTPHASPITIQETLVAELAAWDEQALDSHEEELRREYLREALSALSSAERRNEELVSERLASWMIQHSIATGHGDTFEDLLGELSAYVRKMQADRAPSHSSHRILADAVVSRDERIASLTGQVGALVGALSIPYYDNDPDGLRLIDIAHPAMSAARRALEPSPPGISTTGGDDVPTPSPKATEPAERS